MTENTKKTNETFAWLESETWDEGIVWQTGFQTEETIWQNQNSATKTLTPSETTQKNYPYQEPQFVEVSEEDLLMTDTIEKNALLNNSPDSDFKQSNTISIAQEVEPLENPLYKELNSELTEPFLDHFLSNDSANLTSQQSLNKDLAKTEQNLTNFSNTPSVPNTPTPISDSPNKPASTKSSSKNSSYQDNLLTAPTAKLPETANYYSKETMAINVPVELVPIVRDLIKLFEKKSAKPLPKNLGFKNSLRNKNL